jgi:hypothetical protein
MLYISHVISLTCSCIYRHAKSNSQNLLRDVAQRIFGSTTLSNPITPWRYLMLYSNVWNRYSALLDYHYYYIIYHNIYMSLTRVYRLWNSSVSLLALQMMPERQSNIWRYLQTTYISVFNLLLHKSYTNKQILYYPQTLYSVQGVKTSNKYIEIDDSS